MNTPVQKFGKDHWSMFAYIETLCVDGVSGVGTIHSNRVASKLRTRKANGGYFSSFK